MKYKKRTIAGVVAGTVLAGGAAFAAVTIFGGGHAAVAAAVPNALTVDNVQFTSTLLPGGSANVKGDVHNPNNFPVKVTDVIVVDNANTHGVGPVADCGPGKLTVNGVHNSYAISSSGPNVDGWKFHLGTPVSIAANGGGATIEVANAVTQAALTQSFCGFDADIAVVATAGN